METNETIQHKKRNENNSSLKYLINHHYQL